MNVVEANAIIQDIEQKFDKEIAGLNLFGFNLWPLYRQRFTFEALPAVSKEKSGKSVKDTDSIFKMVRTALRKRGSVAILTSSVTYNTIKDGQLISPRTAVLRNAIQSVSVAVISEFRDELLAEKVKGTIFAPEIDFNINHLKTLRRYLKYPSLLIALIVFLLHRKKLKAIGIQKGAPRQLALFIADFFAALFYFVLLRPRSIVFRIASYGTEGLILALKILSIPILEFQHGTIYSSHPGYNYSASLALLKHRMLVSDLLLVNGSYWRDSLLKGRFFKERDLKVVGSDAVPPNFAKQHQMSATMDVLVASNLRDNQRMRNFIRNYIQKSEYAKKYIFLVRAHPRENVSSKQAWETLAKEFPQQIKISQDDTYELLQKVGIQITGPGTTLFEGARLGVWPYVFVNNFGVDKTEIWHPELGESLEENYLEPLLAKDIPASVAELVKSMYESFNPELFSTICNRNS